MFEKFILQVILIRKFFEIILHTCIWTHFYKNSRFSSTHCEYKKNISLNILLHILICTNDEIPKWTFLYWIIYLLTSFAYVYKSKSMLSLQYNSQPCNFNWISPLIDWIYLFLSGCMKKYIYIFPVKKFKFLPNIHQGPV